MNFETAAGGRVDSAMVRNYFRNLVDRFFKILPVWESGDGSVAIYMESLRSELMGCRSLILAINSDGEYLSLISMLQDLIDHPEYEHDKVRRVVFNSISICNKLNARYFVEVKRDESVDSV